MVVSVVEFAQGGDLTRVFVQNLCSICPNYGLKRNGELLPARHCYR
jgi:hypothetical protein